MLKREKINIYSITHKKYAFPASCIYSPLHVGKQGKQELGYCGDDTGDQISKKNLSHCELTGMYWVWKNAIEESNYIGFVHYRRYFEGSHLGFKGKKILDEDEIIEIFKTNDVIVPVKRKYYIESVYNHYKNAHVENDLIKTREIILEFFPEYESAFDKVMQGKSLYLCNMFIIKKNIFDEYMEWLFFILDKLESRIDTKAYDGYQSRVFGFIGERLLNIWIEHSDLNVKEIKVVNLEGEEYVKKAVGLMQRKFRFGRK